MNEEKVGAKGLEFAGWQSPLAPVMRNGEKRTQPRCMPQGITTVGRCPEKNDHVSDTCSTAAQDAQRLLALTNANLVRFDRSDVRRRLVSFELDFDKFLDETPASCMRTSLFRVLTWLPNIGRNRAQAIVRALREDDPDVSADTRMGELSSRAKYKLYALVDPHLDEYKRIYVQAAA